MEKEELEKLCKQCGRCCRDKLKIKGEICIFMNSPCPYLDKDNKCSIYSDRFNIGKYEVVCLNLEQAIKDEILPRGCGYQELFPPNYKYPKEINRLRDVC